MADRSKLELGLLGAAILMGVLGDALLRTLPWGLNFFLWMTALLAALLLLGRARPEALAGSGRWLILPLILFSLLFLWHDAPVLKLLNILALLVGLSLVMLRAQGGGIRLAGIVEYMLGSAIAGFNAAFGIIPLVFGNAEWKKLLGDRGQRRTLAVARGIVLSIPLLLLFGGLFMGADAVFKNLVTNALRLNFRPLFIHFFVAAFCAWTVGGFLRGVLLGEEWEKCAGLRLPALSLGTIEIGIALGLLDLLFLLFVFVQFRYFFGGAALVQATTGLTYSEYARRGFFELIAVATLALPLLLGAHYLLEKSVPACRSTSLPSTYAHGSTSLTVPERSRREDGERQSNRTALSLTKGGPKPACAEASAGKHPDFSGRSGAFGGRRPGAERLFRALAGVLVALLFVIMVSAFQRLRLYQAEYGLSEQRLYPTAFMGWLAVVFVWFVLTVLRGRREQFWFGAMAAGFALIAVLHVLNPDALIARTNIARAKAGRRFDPRYAAQLSADAVPALVAGLPDLSPPERCGLAAGLLERWPPTERLDWRAWNPSRARAFRVVSESRASLRGVVCGEHK
jgi:hypothetical protein